MSRESDFATRIAADATLMAVLTGGVYQAGSAGLEGLGREATPGAFDASGFLKPCALVRQRGNVPDGNVRDGLAQVVSATQVIEIWLYCDQSAGYTPIDAALARLFVLFEGYIFADSYPVELVNVIDRARDEGALSGASLARQDWAVYSILGG